MAGDESQRRSALRARIAIGILAAENPLGPPHVTTHQDQRLGAVLPLAAVFTVFGVGTLSLALLPLLCTALTGSLVAWLASRVWGDAVGLTAGLLYAFLPMTIDLAMYFVPEPLGAFELTLASALFLSALERTGRPAVWRESLAGVLIGVAYLTTEAGVLLLPACYAYLLVTRRLRLEHGWLLAGFVGVFSAELAYHAIVHGTPLYRFTQTGAYPADPMVADANAHLAYRLLRAYPCMFVWPNNSFGVYGPFMAAGGTVRSLAIPRMRVFRVLGRDHPAVLQLHD